MAADDPTPAAPPPDAPQTPGESEASALTAVAWRVLTAPTTLLVLGAAVGLQLAWAAFVPSDLDHDAIATAVGFGTAEIIVGLGANAPASSWPFWLLVLLMVLNLLGRAVAPRTPHPASAPAASMLFHASPAAVPDALSKLAHPNMFRRLGDGQSLVLRRGARVEGAALLILGLAALVASFAITTARGLDARATLPLGGPPDAMRSRVVVGGIEIDRALPLRIACNPPDPQDPTRTLGCVLADTDGGEGQQFVLRPGQPVHVGAYRIEADHTRHAAFSVDRPLAVLWRTPERSQPWLVPVNPGTTVQVDGTEKTTGLALTAQLAGALPWFIAANGNNGAAQVHLATPLIAPRADAPQAPGSFSVMAPETLSLRIATTPARWLTWAGLLLMVLGLALWAIVPDLTLTAMPAPPPASGAATVVTVSSLNRPVSLAFWLSALSAANPAVTTTTATDTTAETPTGGPA
jgi:hypothetical protein